MWWFSYYYLQVKYFQQEYFMTTLCGYHLRRKGVMVPSHVGYSHMLGASYCHTCTIQETTWTSLQEEQPEAFDGLTWDHETPVGWDGRGVLVANLFLPTALVMSPSCSRGCSGPRVSAHMFRVPSMELIFFAFVLVARFVFVLSVSSVRIFSHWKK